MQNTYTWKVNPSTEPTVIRNCPKCGCQSEYESTGCFRVNANSNHIDIWLIYQCRKCKSTWNLEILSRVHPHTINKELYNDFLNNDPVLAKRYAFDSATHSRNKSVVNFDQIDFEISGPELIPTDFSVGIQLELITDYPMDLRLDRLLSRQLGISREQVKSLSRSGKITGDGIKDIGKAKLRNGMLLTISL